MPAVGRNLCQTSGGSIKILLRKKLEQMVDKYTRCLQWHDAANSVAWQRANTALRRAIGRNHLFFGRWIHILDFCNFSGFSNFICNLYKDALALVSDVAWLVPIGTWNLHVHNVTDTLGAPNVSTSPALF